MNDLKLLIERKQKLGSISKAAILGLPIILSLSRVFREWAAWMVMPYRVFMPLYVVGFLVVYYFYRKTLHEIIFFKLKQDASQTSLDKDELATVNEIKNRNFKIKTLSWGKRNFWLIVSFFVAVSVDGFLWTLAKFSGTTTVLTYIFAVLAMGVIGIYYWRHEYFSKQEKLILVRISE